MLRRLPFLLALALAGFAPACKDSASTTVVGTADFALGPASNTGFDFARDTNLPDDATSARTGTIGGHCILGADSVDVRLAVIGGTTQGVSWMDVHVVGTAPNEVATVEADVNGAQYGADCDQLALTVDRTHRTFTMTGSCPLLSVAPDTVTLTADLEFDGCQRQ